MQPSRNFRSVRQVGLVERERTIDRKHREVGVGDLRRNRRFVLEKTESRSFADVEVHLLKVDGGGQPFAHVVNQLAQVAERGQLLRELDHRSAVTIGVPVDEHVDHRLDAPLHRDEHAGDQKS